MVGITLLLGSTTLALAVGALGGFSSLVRNHDRLVSTEEEEEVARFIVDNSEVRFTAHTLYNAREDRPYHSRRSTRGANIRIAGGQRVVDSSILAHAFELAASDAAPYESEMWRTQFFRTLLAQAKREGFWFLTAGGQRVVVPPIDLRQETVLERRERAVKGVESDRRLKEKEKDMVADREVYHEVPDPEPMRPNQITEYAPEHAPWTLDEGAQWKEAYRALAMAVVLARDAAHPSGPVIRLMQRQRELERRDGYETRWRSHWQSQGTIGLNWRQSWRLAVGKAKLSLGWQVSLPRDE